MSRRSSRQSFWPFVNCSSGQGNGGCADRKELLPKRQRNYWQKSCLCLQVCCPESWRKVEVSPPEAARQWGRGLSGREGGWVSQEEGPSGALGTGRTLSIKSPCKSAFLSSAPPPALLTPTNSWGNINSPVVKERERERERKEWRAVWGSRRVRVMRWTQHTPSQCPLSSCCVPKTWQHRRRFWKNVLSWTFRLLSSSS